LFLVRSIAVCLQSRSLLTKISAICLCTVRQFPKRVTRMLLEETYTCSLLIISGALNSVQ